MLKNKSELSIIIDVILVLLVVVLLTGYIGIERKYKKEIYRDRDYEYYCDSLYRNNISYYEDVLIETDEFQSYIDEHGEWWAY